VFEDRRIPVTVSAGCAVLDECPSRSADELLGKADARLYEAKHQGRNRVVGPR
jgi:two-component system, cell cycle response regulator